jgi:hypothetical protein
MPALACFSLSCSEIELTPSGDRNLAFKTRFPAPYFSGHDSNKGE